MPDSPFGKKHCSTNSIVKIVLDYTTSNILLFFPPHPSVFKMELMRVFLGSWDLFKYQYFFQKTYFSQYVGLVNNKPVLFSVEYDIKSYRT